MTIGLLQLLAFWMFASGVAGVIIRRSPLAVFMAIELMMNAANLLIVTGSGGAGMEAMGSAGLAGVFILIAVGAAEVAVGLAVMVAMARDGKGAGLDRATTLKG